MCVCAYRHVNTHRLSLMYAIYVCVYIYIYIYIYSFSSTYTMFNSQASPWPISAQSTCGLKLTGKAGTRAQEQTQTRAKDTSKAPHIAAKEVYNGGEGFLVSDGADCNDESAMNESWLGTEDLLFGDKSICS